MPNSYDGRAYTEYNTYNCDSCGTSPSNTLVKHLSAWRLHQQMTRAGTHEEQRIQRPKKDSPAQNPAHSRSHALWSLNSRGSNLVAMPLNFNVHGVEIAALYSSVPSAAGLSHSCSVKNLCGPSPSAAGFKLSSVPSTRESAKTKRRVRTHPGVFAMSGMCSSSYHLSKSATCSAGMSIATLLMNGPGALALYAAPAAGGCTGSWRA